MILKLATIAVLASTALSAPYYRHYEQPEYYDGDDSNYRLAAFQAARSKPAAPRMVVKSQLAKPAPLVRQPKADFTAPKPATVSRQSNFKVAGLTGNHAMDLDSAARSSKDQVVYHHTIADNTRRVTGADSSVAVRERTNTQKAASALNKHAKEVNSGAAPDPGIIRTNAAIVAANANAASNALKAENDKEKQLSAISSRGGAQQNIARSGNPTTRGAGVIKKIVNLATYVDDESAEDYDGDEEAENYDGEY
ncbi:hypothetical protein HDV03_002287 [Kappamyces sp. JEL0829]|nr:hypothetical protein HDV03_002287 [Kappamyces sp. JEL0829]